MALTALAGPVSNVLLTLVFLFLYGLLYRALYSVQFLLDMIWLTAYISLALAIFNIIPISPLDGSKVLFALLPDAAYAKLMRYERYRDDPAARAGRDRRARQAAHHGDGGRV